MIVATETGILHRMRQENPEKTFMPANDAAVCRYMKMITLPKLRDALRDMRPEVRVPAEVARAGPPSDRANRWRSAKAVTSDLSRYRRPRHAKWGKDPACPTNA